MSVQDPITPSDTRRIFTSAQRTALAVGTILLTIFGCWAFVRFYVLPQSLPIVSLSEQEQLGLDRKLALLEYRRDKSSDDPRIADPQPYSEEGASRVVEFSERELNGLFAQDPQWGSRIAINLSEDLVSLTALMPVPPDFPVMSRRNVRVQAGAELMFANGRPALLLKGVTVMGIPLPEAWLGDLKNVDLIARFGNDPGFWKAFAAGIETVEVTDDRLLVELRE